VTALIFLPEYVTAPSSVITGQNVLKPVFADAVAAVLARAKSSITFE
jgi:hypothetical protein